METAAPTTASVIVAALQDPATYRPSPFHDVAVPIGPIVLCETHISWVALAGCYAYKIKKPVRLDFLDYSSLDKRHAACLAELDFNRRWAPELYLGLSRLVRTSTGLSFDVDGELLEYAVRMRRFAHENELDHLVATRSVEAADLAAFGTFIANLHAAAPRGRSDLGRPEFLHAAALQSLDSLRTAQPSSIIDSLTTWTEQTWPGIEVLLANRRATGHVRECHGDLHCGNVVRIGGRLVPFDGIDFDAGLRVIDVASDVAFIVMDLEARARSDLAMACLSAWLAQSGDYDVGPCLRFLLVYRALVRAKIASLRARDPSLGVADAAARESAAYVEHAYRTATRRTGSLVLMHGYSGSGKSALAGALVPAFGAVHIRTDIVRKQPEDQTATVPAGSGVDLGLYAPERRARTYEQLARAAEGLLLAGLNVIADATFLDPRWRNPFIALARSIGAPVVILSCEAAADVLRARVLGRTGDASEATLAVLEQQLRDATRLPADPAAPVVTVHTDAEVSVPEVCTAIGAAMRPDDAPGNAPA